MIKYIVTLALLITIFTTHIWTTTIVNIGDSAALVTVTYRDVRCKPITQELEVNESFSVNETCERNHIEVRTMNDGSSGKIILTGGYNNKGEIIKFK